MSVFRATSAKIRVAACHFEFTMDNCGPVVDTAYLNRIHFVERFLLTTSRQPHLIVFPEAFASDELINRAKSWAKRGIATVCGTRLEPSSQTINAVIVTPKSIIYAPKINLSPYDAELAGVRPRCGDSDLAMFSVDVADHTGSPFSVGVGVLVCMDFRFVAETMANTMPVSLVVVPMFEDRVQEPFNIARNLAKRHFVRTILVNKASFRIRLPQDRRTTRLFRLADWLSREQFFPRLLGAVARFFRMGMLPSAAFGPMNANDRQHLKSIGLKPNAQALRIWTHKKEAIVCGDYEVGVHSAPGNDSVLGAGYFYSSFTVDRFY